MPRPRIKLCLPPTDLPGNTRHYLLYIPWDKKYLSLIPHEFQHYFLDCFPLLRVRTTNVHVAVCFQYFDQLINEYEKNNNSRVDRLVIGLALILHDVGWSRLNQSEIAASLGVTGLELTPSAIDAKDKHAIEGEKIARQILLSWDIPPLQTDLICRCIRWHDQPERIANTDYSPEIKLLVDLDHLWSFTELNFWQDVFRKGVEPEVYAANLKKDLNGYFITAEGKSIARKLLSARIAEI